MACPPVCSWKQAGASRDPGRAKEVTGLTCRENRAEGAGQCRLPLACCTFLIDFVSVSSALRLLRAILAT